MNLIMAGIISLIVSSSSGNATLPGFTPLAHVEYSLQDRYTNSFVNDVFADNILLTMAYMRGVAQDGKDIDWTAVKAPFNYQFTLKPGETFAFHDRVLKEYDGKIKLTTNAHFNSVQGFRSDGYLIGDGVCHLASFMNVAARDAHLRVFAPTNHDFAKIADVPKEMGVSIYYDPTSVGSSAQQNLYITNDKDYDVTFNFIYRENILHIFVTSAEAI